MKIPYPRFVPAAVLILVALWLPGVPLPGSLAQEKVELPPGMVSIRAGEQPAVGILLNDQGGIAAPEIGGAATEWTVQLDGQPYPAIVVKALPQFSLVLLQVQVSKPTAFAPLSQSQPRLGTKLRLAGLDAMQRPVSQESGSGTVRRRIPNREGSYYEVPLPNAPLPGSVLWDPVKKEVHGMLVPGAGEGAARLLLFSASITERAAIADMPIGGTGGTPQESVLRYADGTKKAARVRTVRFRTGGREEVRYVRALNDWRRYTGFWVNTLTSPIVLDNRCYFGGTVGETYCVDLSRLERLWVSPNSGGVFSPPGAGADMVCVASGDLGFRAAAELDPLLSQLLGEAVFRTRRRMYDHSEIMCLDRASGVFKWSYQTRFVTQPLIVGNRVMFSGMGALGVLNLADGKEIWTKIGDRKDTTPVFYSLAGAVEDRMWALRLVGNVTGEGTDKEPLRLESAGRDVQVGCYSTETSDRMLWDLGIKTRDVKGAPALNGALIMSSDKKVCYGAAGADLFAIDAQTGKLLWQKQPFADHFGGNLAEGESLLFANSRDRKLTAFNPQDGSVAWTFEGAQGVLCIPLAHEGYVYVGSLDTSIYALDARTGKLIWQFQAGGRISGQPRIVGNRLYCTADDGQLTELELPQ